MKIKNLLYLALLPLSVVGAVLSYRFINRKPDKGHRTQNKQEPDRIISPINEFDIHVMEMLENYYSHYSLDGKIMFTSKRLFYSYPMEMGEKIDTHDVGRSLSKLHKHYPNTIYKKKINGKEVRSNAGYVWVYEPKNIDN